ncbi:hypothetical protein LINGRAHAP2_LOCUS29308 [Linum grandiflorum]
MRVVVNGLQLAWTLGILRLRFNPIRWRPLLFLLRILILIINMRPLLCSSRSFAGANG